MLSNTDNYWCVIEVDAESIKTMTDKEIKRHLALEFEQAKKDLLGSILTKGEEERCK